MIWQSYGQQCGGLFFESLCRSAANATWQQRTDKAAWIVKSTGTGSLDTASLAITDCCDMLTQNTRQCEAMYLFIYSNR